LLLVVLGCANARAAAPEPALNQVPPPLALQAVAPPPFAFDSAVLRIPALVLRLNAGWQSLGMNVLRPALLRQPTDLLLTWDDAPASAAVPRLRKPHGERSPAPWWAIEPQDGDDAPDAAP
jgi:hypothetical protein